MKSGLRAGLLTIGLVLAVGLPACGTSGGATRGIGPIRDAVPTPPEGFGAPLDVQPRTRADIFEQINGGSASYLRNGMQDAVFASIPVRGGGEFELLELEVYRFETPAGAAAQFSRLHGEEGRAWKQATLAVRHEYGVELLADRYVVRITFNEGEEGLMRKGAEAAATDLLSRL